MSSIKSRPPAIVRLPPDVLAHILSFLTWTQFKDETNAPWKVCRAFAQAAQKAGALPYRIPLVALLRRTGSTKGSHYLLDAKQWPKGEAEQNESANALYHRPLQSWPALPNSILVVSTPSLSSELINTYKGYVRTLVLDFYENKVDQERTNLTNKLLLEMSPTVEYVKLWDVETRLPQFEKDAFPSLQFLEIASGNTMSQLLDQPVFLERISQQLVGFSIREVVLSDSRYVARLFCFLHAMSRSGKLQYLHIGENCIFPSQGILDARKELGMASPLSFPSVKHMTVVSPFLDSKELWAPKKATGLLTLNVSGTLMQHTVADMTPTLQTLRLLNIGIVTSDGVQTMTSHLVGLTELDMRANLDFDECSKYLPSTLHKLRICANKYTLTSAAFAKTPIMSSLTNLHINCFRGISETVVCSLLSVCPHLKTLWLEEKIQLGATAFGLLLDAKMLKSVTVRLDSLQQSRDGLLRALAEKAATGFCRQIYDFDILQIDKKDHDFVRASLVPLLLMISRDVHYSV